MKKIVGLLAILIVCSVASVGVLAKSIRDKQFNYKDSVLIEKSNTESKFHTSILPTYLNMSDITVVNSVQRRNIFGNWVNKVQNEFFISSINKSYIINVNLKSTSDTRATWTNFKENSVVTANFYINNGYDYDVNITARYLD